jgi:hypothetical protein
MEFIMHPIGVIHSPFTEKDQTPIQASRSQAVGRVELYPEFAEGLNDIEGLSHIYLLYVFINRPDIRCGQAFLDDQEHQPPRISSAPQPDRHVLNSFCLIGQHSRHRGVDVLVHSAARQQTYVLTSTSWCTNGWYETQVNIKRVVIAILLVLFIFPAQVSATDLPSSVPCFLFKHLYTASWSSMKRSCLITHYGETAQIIAVEVNQPSQELFERRCKFSWSVRRPSGIR